MLAHAMDEAADLPVYLHTLWEQLEKIAIDLENGELPEYAAKRIFLLMRK